MLSGPTIGIIVLGDPLRRWVRIPTMSLGHSEIMSLAVPT
jgi:hypothetical protein